MIKKILQNSGDNQYITTRLDEISEEDITQKYTYITCSLENVSIKDIQLSRAVMALRVTHASPESINLWLDGTTLRYFVDTAKNSANDGFLYLDITDELHDAINAGNNSVTLYFDGWDDYYYTFDQSVSKLYIEYSSKNDANANSEYISCVSSLAGSGEINLATGALDFSFIDTALGQNVLPIKLSHHYNQNLADSNEFNCGKGWKLSAQQYLYPTEKNVLNDNKEACNRYTWVNAQGKNIIFEEKYYFEDDNKEKIYIDENQVTINADNSLSYYYEGKFREVKVECTSEDGYILSAQPTRLNNIDKFNYDSEEIASLKQQIKSVNAAIDQIEGRSAQSTYGAKYITLQSTINSLQNSMQSYHDLIHIDFDKLVDTIKEIADILKQDNSSYQGGCNSAKSSADHLLANYYNFAAFDFYNSMSLAEVNSEIDRIITYISSIEYTVNNLNDFTHDVEYRDALITADGITSTYNYDTYSQAGSTIANIRTVILSIKQNFQFIKTQINEQFNEYNLQLEEYNTQLEKLTEQLRLIESQYPTYFITDEQGAVILGFAKIPLYDKYRLVVTMDNYENCIYYIYDKNNKLVKIEDNKNNNIVLSYIKNNLSLIVDSNGNEIRYTYFDERLDNTYINNEYNRYFYNEKGYLVGAVNNDDVFGTGFIYENDRVINTFGLQTYKNITAQGLVRLSTSEIAESEKVLIGNTTYKKCNSVSINYYDYQTTIVTDDETGKSSTYQFDKGGNLICSYEGSYEKALLGQHTKGVSYSRIGNKINFSASQKEWAEELLSAENQTCYAFSSTVSNGQTIFTSGSSFDENKKIENVLSDETVQNIKNNSTNCFVLTAWAKADSLWINTYKYNALDNGESEFSNDLSNLILSNGDGRENRKFELRVEATVLYGEYTYTRIYRTSFDWMNTNWQYCAVPVKFEQLDKERLQSIKVVFDYSNNYGNVEVFNLSFKEGDYNYTNFTTTGKISASHDSESSFLKEYFYNTVDDRLNTIDYYATLPGEEDDSCFSVRYFYNAQNSLIKTVDEKGIVTENVYDEKGNVIKEMVYHKDEPANKFITEKVINEDGTETQFINELGNKSTTVCDKMGNTVKQIDCLGNETAFGYDETTGALKNVTATNKGEPTSNVNEYRLGLLVKTSHNGSVYEFEYDGEGRKTGVKINGETYCTIAYEKPDIQIITYANGERVKKEIFDDGNKYDVFYAQNGGGFGEPTLFEFDRSNVDTQKDIMAYKEFVEDRTNGNVAKYKTYYDKKNRVVKTEASESGYGKKLRIANTYGFENALTQQKVEIDNISADVETRTYEYGLTNKLISISHKNGFTENPKLDKLGRVSGVSKSNGLSKNYKYIQVGERATNLLASETFGEDGKTKEKLSYTYNKLGNITEIRNNGELVVRYGYDELNRLVREDNRELSKSFFTSYDSAGNITQRKECDFTLEHFDNLEKVVVGEYEYAASGNKDRLLFFNGEECLYDSLDRPSTYRGSDVEWTHVNRLAEINGATFKYNYQGVRLFKTFGDKTTKFYYDGTKLLCQENETDNLYFYYGTEGVTAFKYNGNVYHYKKDILGNILGIYDENNCLIAKYVYDAWGNHKTFALNSSEWVDISSQTAYNENSSLNEKLAILNPFRYRSYYFDIETGFYYLQSRYYDPQVGRFLSPDSLEYLDPETIHGLNLFAYCLNNPVMGYDPVGTWDWGRFGKAALIIGLTIAAVAITVASFGAGSVGGAMLIGAAIGVGAEVFSQTVIDNKSFGQINLLQVAIAGIGGAISAIPALGAFSILTGAATTGLTTAAGGGSFQEVIVSTILGAIGAGVGFGIHKIATKIGSTAMAKQLSQLSKTQLKQAMKPFFSGAVINSAKNISYVLASRPDIPKILFGNLIPQIFNSSIAGSLGIASSLLIKHVIFKK